MDLGPRKDVKTPMELLTLIGRNADKRLEAQAESWEKLSEVWKKGSEALAEAGLSVSERKFIMRGFSRYTQGFPRKVYAPTPRPPKKFRGWGQAIQHGVRVRGMGMKPLA